MKERNCHCCGGSGKETDHRAVGMELRKLREQAGVSLREMAARLEISPPYLSDMEKGNRHWSHERICDFKTVLEEKKA